MSPTPKERIIHKHKPKDLGTEFKNLADGKTWCQKGRHARQLRTSHHSLLVYRGCCNFVSHTFQPSAIIWCCCSMMKILGVVQVPCRKLLDCTLDNPVK